MNMYFVYNLQTGEIVSPYLGYFDGDWANIPDGCAVIGPIDYDTAPQIHLDALADPELYFVSNGQVQIKPNSEAIKQARLDAANSAPPSTEERIATLQAEKDSLAKFTEQSSSAMSEQLNGLIDYMTQTGQLV